MHIRLWVFFSQALMVPASQGLEKPLAACPLWLETGQMAVATSTPEMLRRAEYKDVGWTALLTVQCGRLFWFCMPSSSASVSKETQNLY